MSSISRTLAIAGALALGVGSFSARGQVAGAARPMEPSNGGRVGPGSRPGSPAGRYFASPYRGGDPAGWGASRPRASSADSSRDWSTGRNIPLAKPWLRPLPR